MKEIYNSINLKDNKNIPADYTPFAFKRALSVFSRFHFCMSLFTNVQIFKHHRKRLLQILLRSYIFWIPFVL